MKYIQTKKYKFDVETKNVLVLLGHNCCYLHESTWRSAGVVYKLYFQNNQSTLPDISCRNKTVEKYRYHVRGPRYIPTKL